MSPIAEVPATSVDAWPVLPLAPDVTLHIVRDMPVLDAPLESRVAALWERATSERRLFNGRVFCADTIEPHRIEGHWTEYRRIMAQMLDLSLVPLLGVRSLAVCGALTGPDGVVVARREPRSAYQAGLWQLPPAGSVDHGAAEPGGANWQRALLAELQEELGLDASCIGSMRPLCLVQHPTGVLDMGVHITTPLTAAELAERHSTQGDDEYDALLTCPIGQVEAEVAARGGTLVPSAAPFLRALPAATRR